MEPVDVGSWEDIVEKFKKINGLLIYLSYSILSHYIKIEDIVTMLFFKLVSDDVVCLQRKLII